MVSSGRHRVSSDHLRIAIARYATEIFQLISTLVKAWALIRSSAVHLREWEGEYVVFAEGTAVTHLLGPAAGAVLLAIQESKSPLSIPQLIKALGFGTEGEELGQQEVDTLSTILNELERIELIEAVPS